MPLPDPPDTVIRRGIRDLNKAILARIDRIETGRKTRHIDLSNRSQKKLPEFIKIESEPICTLDLRNVEDLRTLFTKVLEDLASQVRLKVPESWRRDGRWSWINEFDCEKNPDLIVGQLVGVFLNPDLESTDP